MIPLFKVFMPEEVDEPLLKTLHSGYITQGPKVEEFERNVAVYLGTPNVVALNSGTSALTLALRLANVEAGDEVITTPMTCSATNLPILSLGAKPVFADVDPITGNMSAETIKRNITDKTKAILFVDWGGMPADLDEIMSVARAHNLKVIEDAAHAFGAVYRGKKIGTVADFTCFSLQAIKHITTGDGGILTCKNDSDYKRAKNLRWFGINRNSDSLDSRISEDIQEWGYKFHMNDLNATIGIVQLEFLEWVIGRQRENARLYNDNLDKFFVRQPEDKDIRSAQWLYTVLLPSERKREMFKRYMQSYGVQVSQVHRRNDEYSVFQEFAFERLIGLDYFSERMICLPVHWGLSYEDQEYIIRLCNQFAKEHGGSK